MAQYSDVFIDQGSSYSATIPVLKSNGLPLDLSGYIARGQIRRNYTSSAYIDFIAAIVDAEGGLITISLTPAQTASLKPGRHMFDVEVATVGDLDVKRVSEGQIHITPRVTQ
jgi:hypothetical protein